MRLAIGGCVALLGVASVCASAGAQDGSGGAKHIENESKLVGVGLWNKFSDVMRVLRGSPTRIELGAVTSIQGGGRQASAAVAGGGMRGGMGGQLMGAGGGGPMMGGGSGSQSIGAQMGMMMMRGKGAANAYGSGSGAPGLPGMGAGGAKGGGDSDIFSPGGAGPGGGGGALMGAGTTGGGQSDSSEGEQTWIYERGTPTNPLTYLFLFNKDGRVIQIQAFGYSSSNPLTRTKNGVNLGDPIGSVYEKYGWPGNTLKDDESGTMLLDYSKDFNVAIQLMGKDGKQPKVVGITIAITEKSQLGIIGFGPSGNARAAVGFGGGGMGGGGMRGGALMGAGGGPAFGNPGGGGGGRGRRGAGGGPGLGGGAGAGGKE